MKMPPQHTLRFKSFDLNNLQKNEKVISSSPSKNDRGIAHVWAKLKNVDPNRLISLNPKSRNLNTATATKANFTQDLQLTNESQLISLIDSDEVLLDITTLPYHIWVPVFRICLQARKKVRVLYVEPDDYKTHPSPSSSNLFDLSVSFGGLTPLPGFVNLSGPYDDYRTLFIPFLGFEGSRAERIINQLEPQPKVIPVIGAPGFQINYPAITIASNRLFLAQNNCNSEIRIAKASCPFEAFDVLSLINQDYRDHFMYIGLVGTRPHALGAIWYAMQNSNNCELLFDHPVHQTNRTSGQGIIHVYDFTV